MHKSTVPDVRNALSALAINIEAIFYYIDQLPNKELKKNKVRFYGESLHIVSTVLDKLKLFKPGCE